MKIFEVTNGPLSVRKDPGGEWIKQFENGARIVVEDESRSEINGYVWWKHKDGWSAERNLDSSQVFMVLVADQAQEKSAPPKQDPTGPVIMQIGSNDVRVRAKPQTSGEAKGWLDKGSKIEVDLSTRTEADGYVWVQHKGGWSAERSLDNSKVFMTVTQDKPAPTVSEAKPETETTQASTGDAAKVAEKVQATTQSKLQAQQGVNTRDKPSTSGNSIQSAYLQRGTVIDIDPDATTDADGYTWVKHKDGWSAWKKTDGTTVFLVQPGSVPGLVEITADGPDPDSLPGRSKLIKRLPVDLDQIQWFQYFGNNVFGYTDGKRFGYDAYSQGLHGGQDYGNSVNGSVPIYAGLECTYFQTIKQSPNLQVWAKAGDYTIIWQHIKNVTNFSRGQQINPNTKIAEIEPSPGYNHLHFEIRYKEVWIVNPLLLMPDEIVQQITGKFKPTADRNDGISELKYFYKKAGQWDQWTSPLDQPMIKLGGSVIGPKAR